MRRATASVENRATSGISVQRAVITRFEWGIKISRPRRENLKLGGRKT